MRPSDDSPLEREREIFLRALEKSSLRERAAYVDGACGDDLHLRKRVESLLRHHGDDGFLEKPAADVAQTLAVEEPISEKPGTIIGRYKLLEQIGEGGCGVVYVAEQEEPVRRRVALKVIKLGMDTRSVIARFEAERQALALMDHPNIAKVLDAGATETGRPYFVMELVRGIKITDYCDQNNLSTWERLDLFIQVCRAIQHAHQKGIIHRDIKPSNILVTLHDGVPVPKMIDFGIAKAITHQRLTDKTLYTAFEQFIGTPAYMSPEQAEMSGLDVDTRSDVYALGVLLYELLTGKTPFDPRALVTAGLDEMRRIIREREPVRPSTRLNTMLEGELTTTAKHRHSEPPKLIHLLKGDLDWIVMKALEKDRTRRYETANGLALDLERHLKQEPVTARPPTTAYRVQKFVRRNKLMVTAAGMVLVALVLGVMVSSWLAYRENQQRKRAEFNEQVAHRALDQEARQRQAAEEARQKAEAAESTARQQAYVSDMNVAFQALRENRLGRVRELLERHRPKPGQPDLRSWEWGHLWHESRSDELYSLEGSASGVSCIAFSPNGKLLASASDETVKIWDLASRRAIVTLPHTGYVADLVFTSDGRYLVTTSDVSSAAGSVVRYWEVGSWRETVSFAHEAGVMSLAVSPHGRFLAVTLVNGEVVLQDSATTSGPKTLATAASGHRTVRAVFASREPILVLEDTNGLALWNVEQQQKLRTIPFALQSRLHRMHIPPPVALSPDGTSLAVGGTSIEVLDLNRNDERLVRTNLTSEVWAMSFSPDGAKLATADADNLVTIWDTSDWKRWAELKGHRAAAREVAFSPDGSLLASAGPDRSIRFWSMSAPPESRPRHRQPEGWIDGSWSYAEATLYWYGDNRIVITTGIPDVNVITNRLPMKPRSPVHVSPRGRQVCFTDQKGTPGIWDAATMKPVSTLTDAHTVTFTQNSFSPDEALLVGAEEVSRTRRVFSVVDGREIARLQSADLAEHHWWGSDSQTLMIDDRRGRGVHLWDVKTHAIGGFLPHDGGIWGAVMSRDGSLIATLDGNCGVKTWNRADRRLLHSFETQGAMAYFHFPWPMDFTQDNRRLVVVAGQREVRIFDLVTGQEVGSPALGSGAWGCHFSQDGTWLAVRDTPGVTFLRTIPLSEAHE